MTSIYGRGEVTVEIGDFKNCQQVVVADIIADCILGLDFMNAFSCRVDIPNRILELQDMQVPLFQSVTCDAPMCHRLTLNCDAKLKSRAEVIAPAVMVAGSVCDGLGVVEPVDDASASFVVGRTLVDCSIDVVPVRFANTTGNPIYPKKGTVVGSCRAVCCQKGKDRHNQPSNLLIWRTCTTTATKMWTQSSGGCSWNCCSNFKMFSPPRRTTSAAPASRSTR